jgi:hypothetical protein
VSGFEGTEVLHGRPYGGCAILWRHGALQNVVRLEVNSSRIVAVTCSIGCTMLLLINVYLPCDNDSTFADFAFELSVCEALINEYVDHDIVIGGDFNIDLARTSANTKCLYDFCVSSNMICADFHSNADIDYTYRFDAAEYFSTLDHFILGERLFRYAVSSVTVDHTPDNLSDHDPIVVTFDLNISLPAMLVNNYCKKFVWYKATANDIDAYKKNLSEMLSVITVPVDTLTCYNCQCNDMSHFRAIDSYYNAIYGCCYSAAKGIIPISTHGKSVAGWNEVARPIREKSLFWHHIWSEAGRPRCGVLADIMRQTRCRYRYAVRKLRKN